MSNNIDKSGIPVESLIRLVRGQKVILDSDLANIYAVTTKRLNEQVRRNRNRFPEDFMFQLSNAENDALRSQIATSNKRMRSQFATASKRNIRHFPAAFTEHGAIMVATILNSPRAVEMSVFVVRAFVKMREQLTTRHLTKKRLAEIERMLLGHDASLRDLYAKIRPLLLPSPDPPKRKIGFRAEEKRAVYSA